MTEEMNVDDLSSEEMLASLEEKPEAEAQEAPIEGTEEPAGFQFKSLDELMGHKLKYTANGKDVEEDLNTILKRASQGYHYAQRMGDLKTQESEWQTKLADAQSLSEKYAEIDTYARGNPEWFDHWNNAYQNRDMPLEAGSPDQPVGFDPAQITSLIDQKLAPFQETFQQQQQRIEQEKVDAQNAELDKQIAATQKEFEDVDFGATDPENGVSLENKVYQFMVDNGISDFNRAYKIMDYENIMARQVEKAKADLVKQEQTKRKQGIVAETSGQAKTPDHVDLNKLSHDQQQKLLLEELNKLRSM